MGPEAASLVHQASEYGETTDDQRASRFESVPRAQPIVISLRALALGLAVSIVLAVILIAGVIIFVAFAGLFLEGRHTQTTSAQHALTELDTGGTALSGVRTPHEIGEGGDQ